MEKEAQKVEIENMETSPQIETQQYPTFGVEAEQFKNEYILNHFRKKEQAMEQRLCEQEQRINALEAERCRFATALNEVMSSNSWRITRPLRALRKRAPEEVKKEIHVSPMQKFVKEPYAQQEIEKLRSVKFAYEPKISVLVPLYNTKESFLREMIDSVVAQTYTNWELCLADGSDGEHVYVAEIVRQYAQKDNRILYRRLERNGGISENTNGCIEMATGDYIGLLDHDDLLHPVVFYEYVKAINEQGADYIYCDEATIGERILPHFKPDFAIDNLRSNNYICHFSMFSKKLLDQVGGYRSEYDGSQDFDMTLRLTEKAEKIVHIPKILYYWRAHQGSVAINEDDKPYAYIAARKAIKAHLDRVGLKGEVYDAIARGMYRIKYELKEKPLISAIILNKDLKYLPKCVASLLFLSTYKNVEVIVVENNSTDPQTFLYYEKMQQLFPNFKVVYFNEPFNYSRMNNVGMAHAKGKYFLFLNNDIEAITPEWIEEMLMYGQRDDVGAVGAKLYFEDDTVQHAGVCIGLGGVAAHWHRGIPGMFYGYMGRLRYAQDVSAVTAACMLVRRDVVDRIGGFNEAFEVEYNDVDFCMRIRQAEYLIVFTPFAELYHYESKTRKTSEDSLRNVRHIKEENLFFEIWGRELYDPYYNSQLPTDEDAFLMSP